MYGLRCFSGRLELKSGTYSGDPTVLHKCLRTVRQPKGVDYRCMISMLLKIPQGSRGTAMLPTKVVGACPSSCQELQLHLDKRP